MRKHETIAVTSRRRPDARERMDNALRTILRVPKDVILKEEAKEKRKRERRKQKKGESSGQD